MLFNGVDLTPYLTVNSVTGRGLAGREPEYEDKGDGVGAHLKRVKRPPRPLEVTVTIRVNVGENVITKIREINDIIITEDPVPIEFLDEPGMIYYGVTGGVQEDVNYKHLHKATISILCVDPNIYNDQQLSLNVGTVLEPHQIVTQVPIKDWKCTATILASTTEFSIENDTGGKVVLQHSFIEGDVIEIYCKYRKIVLNGVVNMVILSMEDTNWQKFTLPKGEVNLKASQACTITYQPTYY